jgi:hypothetical protein
MFICLLTCVYVSVDAVSVLSICGVKLGLKACFF